MSKGIKLLLLVTLGFFTALMLRVTLPYLTFNDNIAFLKIKQWVIDNKIWKFSFYTHVITSCFCLLAGFTQFSNGMLKDNTHIHRIMGWTYITVILFLSGPASFVMSLYANGGTLSQTAFTLLSILWILFTYLALKAALKKDFERHGRLIIRSYALTLSALTLRAWKYLIVIAFRPHPMDVYMVVAWLGWVPNLLIAEWYIRNKIRNTKILLK